MGTLAAIERERVIDRIGMGQHSCWPHSWNTAVCAGVGHAQILVLRHQLGDSTMCLTVKQGNVQALSNKLREAGRGRFTPLLPIAPDPEMFQGAAPILPCDSTLPPREANWDQYVAPYHSSGDDECIGCGETECFCECEDGFSPAYRNDRHAFTYPTGLAKESEMFPRLYVGAELEVESRRSEYYHVMTARAVRRLVDETEEFTRLAFLMEEDGSLPEGGFELISGYGSWNAVSRGWGALLGDPQLHMLVRGVDSAMTSRLGGDGKWVWNWPSGERPLGADDTDPTQVSLAAPGWLRAYGEAAVGDGEPLDRSDSRVWEVMPRRDRCGMHVHVSNYEGLSGAQSHSVQRLSLAIMLDYLRSDPTGYLFVVGRLPDASYSALNTQADPDTRRGAVAVRSNTIEYRLFASTLNPRMFGARVELAMLLFRNGTLDTPARTWAELRAVALANKAEVPNLHSILMLEADFKRSCIEQERLYHRQEVRSGEDFELPLPVLGKVADPAVSGNEECEDMNVSITINAGNSGAVVRLDMDGETVEATEVVSAPTEPEGHERAEVGLGSDASNEDKRHWAVGRFCRPGSTTLYPSPAMNSHRVAAVYFMLDDVEFGEGNLYRSLYREADGFAKLGTSTFDSPEDVFGLRDAENRNFLGVAVLTRL